MASLALSDDPDRVEYHEPHRCRACAADLSQAPDTRTVRRQAIDIPAITPSVTGHRLATRACACGAATTAPAPAGVRAPVSYGPNTTAIVCYLYLGQFLSKQRTADALSELLGCPLSGGTVAAMAARAARGLEEFTTEAAKRIAAAPVAHFDETPLRVAGSLMRVHSASTGACSLLTVHPKRGRAGMEAAGVLARLRGIAVHDAWAPYDTYQGVAGHGLCNAHLLRELQAATDAAPAGSWCWATQAADALREMNRAAGPGSGGAGGDRLGRLVRLWDSAVAAGLAETAPRADKLMAKFHALARRMRNRRADYLRFLFDARVPFDNSAAEREVRMVKIRQKVSGCLRSLAGAEQFCAVRSYLATAAKHGIGFFDALVRLAQGRCWMPETA